MTPEEKGFHRTLRLQGRDLKLLSGPDAGKTFRGTINRIGAFMLSVDSYPDPRGKRILEIANCPLQINSQDKIQDVINGDQFVILEINFDSPDYSTKYVLQQLTDKDA